MNDTEHLQSLNAIQDEINRLSEQAWLKLMALLREGETPRDAIKEVQAAFSGEYETALLSAFNQRLSGYMGKTELNALNISGLTLSQRLYRHNQLTTHSVLNIINDHTKGFHDAQKLALQIYGGYHFRANEPLAARVPLPKYLRAAFGDDAAFKALWRSQYAGSKLAGLADSAGTGPSLAQLYARISATNLKTPALKAAYLQALDALEKGAGQEQLKNVLKTAYYERNRYFANRIAQTELHRAYTDQKALDLMADGGFEYVQIRLSGTHPRADICDLHARVDKYGLGAGVYPKAYAPKPPFHPHCRCLLTPRAWVEGKPIERVHAEQAFLSGLPVDEARHVIGSADKLQQMRKGAAFDKVINDGRPERYHLQRLGEFIQKDSDMTWADMGLPSAKALRTLAGVGSSVPALLSGADSVDEAWRLLRNTLGVAEGGSRHITTPVGNVLLDDKWLHHVVEKRDAARERYANLVLPTLREPTEVWLSKYGESEKRKRFIKLFSDGKHDMLVVVSLLQDDAVWNVIPMPSRSMDNQRNGKLLWKSYQ